MADHDYNIGYRRPPKAASSKGSSGNPKGRPKGSKNFVTLLGHELNQKIVVTEGGRRKSVTRMQAMVKRMVAGALQGEPKALLLLVDILRKNGGIEPPEVQGLLPDNYLEVLDAFVESRKSAKKP